MSRRSPKLELKLNLSPPTPSQRRMARSRSRSASTSPISAPSSCVSSEMDQDETYLTSPEATSSMVLVGCPRCLMYVMLSEDDPKCPKCKSTVLLDFQRFKRFKRKRTTSRFFLWSQVSEELKDYQ